MAPQINISEWYLKRLATVHDNQDVASQTIREMASELLSLRQQIGQRQAELEFIMQKNMEAAKQEPAQAVPVAYMRVMVVCRAPDDCEEYLDVCNPDDVGIDGKAFPVYREPPAIVEAVPVAWKHDCAALLTNNVELWIDACPHCGKPRTAPPAISEPAQAVPQHVIEASNRIPQNIIETPQALPVGRVLHWKGEPGLASKTCIRGFDEYPKGYAQLDPWEEGENVYTAPPAIDDETRKMTIDLCDMIITNKAHLLDISKVIMLREKLEAGNE